MCFPRLLHPVFFFDAAECAQAPGEARGKAFPTIAAPRIFLMRQNMPRRQGKLVGKAFPTIATPRCPPNHLGYRWDPPITHTGYLPIFGIPGGPILPGPSPPGH